MEQRSFGVVPIYRDGKEIKFLLVRHNVGHWSFPKGHPEAGETEVESALRELREETGITAVELVPDWQASESYQFKGRDRGHRPGEASGLEGEIINKTVKYFLGWVGEPSVQILKSELKDYRWVTAQQARKLITFPAARHVLAKVLEYLKQNRA
ncbi:NUDIX domain-containing protein [Patescibacteria group bacterium]|nr:NUDIX domain-containing protein [Patescibacteria group bacterium]